MQVNAQTYQSIKRMAIVGGAGLLILLITAAASRKKELPIQATVVDVKPLSSGDWLIDSADVIKIIERSFGMPLDEQAAGLIDEDRIERILEEDSFVKNAEVMITANSQILIKVEQREPILRIFDNLGASYYVDEFGHKIETSPHYTARTLVATGDIQPHTPEFMVRKKHEFRNLFELSKIIVNDKFWKSLIEQVYVNKRGEFVFIPKIGDQTIIFGDFKDVEDKFSRLKIFYKEAMNREGWKKYHSIDLRYKGQVVCEKN